MHSPSPNRCTTSARAAIIPGMKEEEVRFTVKIPPELAGRLDAITHARGISRNAAVIEAVRQWLAADEPEPVVAIGGANGRGSLGPRGAPSRTYGPRVVGDPAPMPEHEPPETSRGASAIEKLRRLR
jgi:hypothetical protein